MKLFQSLFLTILVLVPILIDAQFGVPKKSQEAAIDENGNVEAENPYADMASRLQSAAPIEIQDAIDIATIIEAAKADPETKAMIAKMKQGDEGEMLAKLSQEVTPLEIVQGLQQSMEDMKGLEVLFADPERAVAEMEKEGLIDKKRLDFYQKNPEALADDTRKSLYFGFVSMAVAGGYLE